MKARIGIHLKVLFVLRYVETKSVSLLFIPLLSSSWVKNWKPSFNRDLFLISLAMNAHQTDIPQRLACPINEQANDEI
ncbi:hypothetical protein VCSRO169_3493 [Vibrio cholerae]|nr:hypothetical protein VCSRO169_3493 [Vibrio cholerae]